MTVRRLSQTTTLSRRSCTICHRSISPTDAVAALTKEEAWKSLVHISCLAADLPDPTQPARMAG